MAASSVRLGVDIGGTFTDVVLEKDGYASSVCQGGCHPFADRPDHPRNHAGHQCLDRTAGREDGPDYH